MPPRVVHAAQAGNGVSAFWNSLPPISRTLTLLMVVVTVAGNYGFLPLGSLALLWKPITKKFEVGWPPRRVAPRASRRNVRMERARARHARIHAWMHVLSVKLHGWRTYLRPLPTRVLAHALSVARTGFCACPKTGPCALRVVCCCGMIAETARG